MYHFRTTVWLKVFLWCFVLFLLPIVIHIFKCPANTYTSWPCKVFGTSKILIAVMKFLMLTMHSFRQMCKICTANASFNDFSNLYFFISYIICKILTMWWCYTICFLFVICIPITSNWIYIKKYGEMANTRIIVFSRCNVISLK